jgi:hypothetical protein
LGERSNSAVVKRGVELQLLDKLIGHAELSHVLDPSGMVRVGCPKLI